MSGQGSGELSPYIAAELQQLAPRIREGLRRTAAHMIGVGADLTRAKALLPHGDWMPWLAMEFDLSVSTAENFMRVARLAEELGGRFANIENLPAAALYELAARSTPAGVVERVMAGEISPTLAAIRDAKTAASTTRSQSVDRRPAGLARAIESCVDLAAESVAEGLWRTDLSSSQVRSFVDTLAEVADLLEGWEREADEESAEDSGPSLVGVAAAIAAIASDVRARRAAERRAVETRGAE